MMDMILFTKPNCDKCEHLKNHDLKGVEVHELNSTNVDALGLLAFYEGCAMAELSLPILVFDGRKTNDINEITDILGCEPYVEGCGDECKLGGGR